MLNSLTTKYFFEKLAEYGKQDIYNFAVKYMKFISEGKSNEGDEKPINKDWIDQGAKVELEHVQDLDMARKISRDHLYESFPINYYEYLSKCEKEIEEKKSANGNT